jgi:hypothetical protein
MLAEKQIANSPAECVIPMSSSNRRSGPFRFSAKRPREWFIVWHHRPRNQLLMAERVFRREVASDSADGERGDSEEGDDQPLLSRRVVRRASERLHPPRQTERRNPSTRLAGDSVERAKVSSQDRPWKGSQQCPII